MNIKIRCVRIDEDLLKTSVDETITGISQKLNQSYPDNVLGTLFKNVTKCTDIVNSIIK